MAPPVRPAARPAAANRFFIVAPSVCDREGPGRDPHDRPPPRKEPLSAAGSSVRNLQPPYSSLAQRLYGACDERAPRWASAGRRGRPGRARVAVRALTFEGYDVEAVGDGAQALEAVLAREPDVVVLDVMMPYVDGLTVVPPAARARHRTLPILMLTARHEVADRVAGLDAGADDYLVKPFALDELLRPAAGAAAAHRASPATTRCSGSATSCSTRRPHALARRPRARAHQDRVRPARAAHAERRHRPRARHDLRAHLGLRLRDELTLARRLRRLPAAQDRGRRRAAPGPHGARRRLRARGRREPALAHRARPRPDRGARRRGSPAAGAYLATARQLREQRRRVARARRDS